MEKTITYLKSKPLETLIALLLLVVIYQQYQIKEEAERCQCSYEIDDIQDDIDDIKDRLSI